MTNLFNDPLIISGKSFKSRLLLGTGKYKNIIETQNAIQKSDSSIVTVALRHFTTGKISEDSITTKLNWKKLWLLPNTAGARTAEEAIHLAYLGREFAKKINQPTNNFVKLEVISDSKYLLPDPIGTIKAAKFLVKKGFSVLPYINADPMLAKHLEDLGCSTIMPLGSPIGSKQGIQNLQNIQIIIENAKVPVIIDAGIGNPHEATLAMEIGADAVLMNTAVAQSKNSETMALAMKLAVEAGRLGFISNKKDYIEKRQYAASASSPFSGIDFLV